MRATSWRLRNASAHELPAAVDALVAGLPAGSLQGKVALIDLPLPAALTEVVFTALVTYDYWPGHILADHTTRDYRRGWLLSPDPPSLRAF